MAKLPKFADLPLNEGDPPFSAWGLQALTARNSKADFIRYGKNDQLGTLNRLTEEVVLKAAKEIKTGVRVSLNWALDAQGEVPFFGRQVFHQNLYSKPPRCVNDDIWTFNTQSSSQWDGLRHFGYQKERKFYNGTTMDEIHAEGSTTLRIGAWSEKGIVGRGILLDYHAWRTKNNIAYSPFKTGSIPASHLKAVAKDQGTSIKFGDILIIRSGYMQTYNELRANNPSELVAISKVLPPTFSGVEQSEEMLEWIWENFSAVAGDHPSFECWPTQKDYHLHEILLAGGGCPIGELFDLEALAEHCNKVNRYEFFITSEVCNVPKGVASPPNILAIF